jgi:hypothetical protein
MMRNFFNTQQSKFSNIFHRRHNKLAYRILCIIHFSLFASKAHHHHLYYRSLFGFSSLFSLSITRFRCVFFIEKLINRRSSLFFLPSSPPQPPPSFHAQNEELNFSRLKQIKEINFSLFIKKEKASGR